MAVSRNDVKVGDVLTVVDDIDGLDDSYKKWLGKTCKVTKVGSDPRDAYPIELECDGFNDSCWFAEDEVNWPEYLAEFDAPDDKMFDDFIGE